MTIVDSDRERWVRKLRAAATEATDCGATPDELAAAVADGIADARRRQAARAGALPTPRRADDDTRPRYEPEPGSAAADLFRATGVI